MIEKKKLEMRRHVFSSYLVLCCIVCFVRSQPLAENFESENPEDHWQLDAQVSFLNQLDEALFEVH